MHAEYFIKMLHELLSALSGYSGAFFNVKSAVQKIPTCAFSEQVFDDAKCYHPSEKVIINELLRLAGLYKKVQTFHHQYCGYSSGATQNGNKDKGNLERGLYLTAFSVSLNKECIGYQETIITLEQKLLENPRLPLSHLLLQFDEYFPLMISLCQVIDEVESKRAHGCKLLECIHEHSLSSVGSVKEAMQRIEQDVYRVFLDQLCQWMLHGTLCDPNEELFIQIKMKKILTPRVEDNPVEEDVIPERGVSEVTHRLSMLPSHIPLSVAETIIFIGESIVFFKESQNRKDSTDFGGLDEDDVAAASNAEFNFASLLEEVSLAQSSSLKEFINAAETVRRSIAEHMSTLVINAGLISALNEVKAIYLLGTGEVYQTFFNFAHHLLKGNISSSLNLNRLFQKAGHQVLLDDELISKFYLFQKPQDEGSVEKFDGWKQLRIEYKVQWPLHQIFNENIREKYNCVFQFLLQIRRAQYRLQQLWISQMIDKKTEQSGSKTKIWMLRHHMNLLIYNLQCYIQVDVLESKYWELKQEISKTKDYQILVRSHHNFISSLISQCFINHPLLASSIEKILRDVHNFCDLFDVSGTLVKDDVVSGMWEEFDRSAGMFFCILATLVQHYCGQPTAQLITRINFNKYYSSKTASKRFANQICDD